MGYFSVATYPFIVIAHSYRILQNDLLGTPYCLFMCLLYMIQLVSCNLIYVPFIRAKCLIFVRDF